MSGTELRGTVLNNKLLGERKNCNLPGVMVHLPVLGQKDVDDVQNFACQFDMDLISASFVQSADDVRWVVGGELDNSGFCLLCVMVT